jgi:site-specific DNA recombinase
LSRRAQLRQRNTIVGLWNGPTYRHIERFRTRNNRGHWGNETYLEVLLREMREPDGYEILINQERAAVVNRIFEMYGNGHSLLTIARTLNEEEVPPPRAGSKKRAQKFWRKATINGILSNRAYIGEWSFGKKRWRKDPVSKKRRYTLRPASEVYEDIRPHLRIVGEAAWSTAHARRSEVRDNYAGRSHGAPGRKTSHAFTGLLHCGVCGHRMVDAGGLSARYYKCSGATSGGICTNRRPVREDVLTEAAVAEMRRVLTETSLGEKMIRKIEERRETFKVEEGRASKQLERQLELKKAEVERLLTFIRSTDVSTSPGAVEAVRSALETSHNEQRQLETRRAGLKTQNTEPPRVPTAKEMTALVLDVEGLIRDDPTRAREALRKALDHGRLYMEPLPDQTYQARSVLFPLRLSGRSRRPRSSGDGEATVGNVSCAGRI